MKKNKQKLNLITSIILGFSFINSGSVFATNETENRINDLNNKINKIITENLIKDWRDEGNLLKYDSYVWKNFNPKTRTESNSYIKIDTNRDRITLGANLLEIRDPTSPYNGEKMVTNSYFKNGEALSSDLNNADNLEESILKNRYSAFKKLSNKDLNDILDLKLKIIPLNEYSTISSYVSDVDKQKMEKIKYPLLPFSNQKHNATSHIDRGILKENISMLDFLKKQENKKLSLANVLSNMYSKDPSINAFINGNKYDEKGFIIDENNEKINPRDYLLNLRKQNKENFDDVFGAIIGESLNLEGVFSVAKTTTDKRIAVNKFFVENFNEYGGFKNETDFEKIKEFVENTKKSITIEEYINSIELNNFYLEHPDEKFNKLAEKYLSIENIEERNKKLREDVISFLSQPMFALNIDNYSFKELEKNNPLAAKIFNEKIDEILNNDFNKLIQNFDTIIAHSIIGMGVSEIYKEFPTVKEKKEELLKEKEFYLALKEAKNEEEIKNLYRNNLGFLPDFEINEKNLEKKLATINNAISFIDEFKDIENFNNLTIPEFRALMFGDNNGYLSYSSRNTEWMRGVIIDNVRDGEISENSKQAVNGSQIYHLRKELNDKIDNNTHRIEQVEKRLDQTTKEMRAGIAGAVALNGIPQASLPGQSAIGVGVGNFKGASALAIGISKKTENGKISFKLSGSVNTNKDVSISGGVGYFF